MAMNRAPNYNPSAVSWVRKKEVQLFRLTYPFCLTIIGAGKWPDRENAEPPPSSTETRPLYTVNPIPPPAAAAIHPDRFGSMLKNTSGSFKGLETEKRAQISLFMNIENHGCNATNCSFVVHNSCLYWRNVVFGDLFDDGQKSFFVHFLYESRIE